MTWVGVTMRNWALGTGADRLQRHASSPEATRSFCGRCGSRLLFESSRWPGEVHVARASFDGEIDRPVAGDAFTDEPATWLPAPGARTP